MNICMCCNTMWLNTDAGLTPGQCDSHSTNQLATQVRKLSQTKSRTRSPQLYNQISLAHASHSIIDGGALHRHACANVCGVVWVALHAHLSNSMIKRASATKTLVAGPPQQIETHSIENQITYVNMCVLGMRLYVQLEDARRTRKQLLYAMHVIDKPYNARGRRKWNI